MSSNASKTNTPKCSSIMPWDWSMFRPQKIMTAAPTIIRVNSAPGALKINRMGSSAAGIPASNARFQLPYHGARPIENNSSQKNTATKNRFAITI
jgi:hypothetical protein